MLEPAAESEAPVSRKPRELDFFALPDKQCWNIQPVDFKIGLKPGNIKILRAKIGDIKRAENKGSNTCKQNATIQFVDKEDRVIAQYGACMYDFYGETSKHEKGIYLTIRSDFVRPQNIIMKKDTKKTFTALELLDTKRRKGDGAAPPISPSQYEAILKELNDSNFDENTKSYENANPKWFAKRINKGVYFTLLHAVKTIPESESSTELAKTEGFCLPTDSTETSLSTYRTEINEDPHCVFFDIFCAIDGIHTEPIFKFKISSNFKCEPGLVRGSLASQTPAKGAGNQIKSRIPKPKRAEGSSSSSKITVENRQQQPVPIIDTLFNSLKAEFRKQKPNTENPSLQNLVNSPDEASKSLSFEKRTERLIQIDQKNSKALMEWLSILKENSKDIQSLYSFLGDKKFYDMTPGEAKLRNILDAYVSMRRYDES